ncbi:magnesium transporter CorA family protein [Candidatus Nitrosocosmicus hydrocola]|uniref:magnesium transporter CorA family protein n=1 Tax=Candidatus Nitrosocosmicus hydrocola TaxID=1826872 RepID=UPI0011E5F519|nr:CorA family divalent cation transporter [Candidatus Nitrosocosmicus hydrocola]
MSKTQFLYFGPNGISYLGDKSQSKHTGDKLWIDIQDPSPEDLEFIKQKYNLDEDSIKITEQLAKRPQVRILDGCIFSILLDIKYKTLKKLMVHGIYIYIGNDWLVTIHTSEVDILSPIKHVMEKKNKRLLDSNILAIYYTIIDEILGRYEQLLTSVELTIIDFEQKSLIKRTSKGMLEYLDMVTRQLLIIRRHFWYTRDMINFLLHMQDDVSKELRYLKIAYDDITQIINLIESYGDTINSTRDLYLANISLQLNDTMRILTIFSVILMPLTLIAGVYGMNVLDLTKLGDIPSGFAIVMISMIIITLLLLLFFKQKRWILDNNKKDGALAYE